VIKLVPFDPASKMSEALVLGPSGETLRVLKGALVAVARLAQTPPAAATDADELAQQGYRVLAVAVGTPRSLQLAGLIALSDPPRADAAADFATGPWAQP
jgi:H+-transporting ATPase